MTIMPKPCRPIKPLVRPKHDWNEWALIHRAEIAESLRRRYTGSEAATMPPLTDPSPHVYFDDHVS